MKDDDEYTVRLLDMPGSVRGLISISDDGHANIYINSKLSVAMQREALRHELKHFRDDDVYNGKSIREVESQ